MPILTGAVMKNTEGMDYVLQVRPRMFSSVVWLYFFNPIPELIREWWVIDGTSSEFGGIDANRKLNPIFVGWRIDALSKYGRLIHQMIQSGPELVEHFSEFNSEFVFRKRGRTDVFDDSLCPVAIHLYDCIVAFWINERFPYLLH